MMSGQDLRSVRSQKLCKITHFFLSNLHILRLRKLLIAHFETFMHQMRLRIRINAQISSSEAQYKAGTTIIL